MSNTATANGLKGARIGVARKYFGFSDAVDAIMEHSIDVMRKQGAVIVDPADIPLWASSTTAR